jgi:capsid assembly protease
VIPFHRVAGLFYNRPLLVTPQVAQTISSYLLTRIEARGGAGGGSDDKGETRHYFAGTARADGSVEVYSPRASRFVGEYQNGADGRPLPYRMGPNGTAIVTIIGELVNRGAWIGASSGLVSYEGIKHQLTTAAKDSRVSSILLDIESPGGEAIGCFDVAETVRDAASVKPVVAVVNGVACSAAYAIASGASRIVSIPDGMSGSIGVVMMHLDFSKQLEAVGVKPTLIFAGAHKVDGNPFEPLPEAVRARFQAEIEQFYGMLVDCVAAGRKGLSTAAIRGTEAQVFLGEDALRAGLVDEIGTFDDVIQRLAAPRRSASLADRKATTVQGKSMTAQLTDSDDQEEVVGVEEGESADAPEEEAAAETPAAEHMPDDDEHDDEEDEERAAAAAAPISAPTLADENARLRAQLGEARREKIHAEVDGLIGEAVRAHKFPAPVKEDGENTRRTAAGIFRKLLVGAHVNENAELVTDLTELLALLPAAAPKGRLAVAPLSDTAPIISETDSVRQRLADRGITPKSRGYSKAFEKELVALRSERAN